MHGSFGPINEKILYEKNKEHTLFWYISKISATTYSSFFIYTGEQPFIL
jgi:hypothetical protein